MDAQRMRKAFEAFDSDGSGFISADELRAILSSSTSSRPHGVTDAEVEEIIADFDADGNGEFDYDEFLEAWSSRPETNEAAQAAERAAKKAAREAAKAAKHAEYLKALEVHEANAARLGTLQSTSESIGQL